MSVYCRDFCEGCESKKCKTPVVRVRARGNGQPNFYIVKKCNHIFFFLFFIFCAKLKHIVHKTIYGDEHPFYGTELLLGVSSQIVGAFLNFVGVFFKKVGAFSENVGAFLEYV